jgi:hypothetical protein
MEIEEALVLKGEFVVEGKAVPVQFYEGKIVYGDKVIPLSFSTIAKVFRTDGKILSSGNFEGFSIEGSHTGTFLSQDQQLMLEVREYFRKRINLRGFHELFKAIKKIGKGSFASVYLAERLEDKLMVAVKAFSKEALREDEKGMLPLIN